MKSRIRQNSISGAAPLFYLWGRYSAFILMGVATFILLISVMKPNVLESARLSVVDLITPALSLVTSPFQNAADAVGEVSGIASLRAENAKLKSENVRLREWYQTALMLQAENQSLQDLLNLKIDPAHEYITARVISDAGSTFVKTLLVSVGKGDDNVQKNQAVLTNTGMIGRIIEVGNKASRILLLNDINSRVPILIEGTSQRAIMYGNNNDTPILKHLPHDASIQVGARVVTSGHGGVFPPGLPIGRIEKSKEGQFFVKLFAEMDKVNYVRIINHKVNQNLILGEQ